MSKLELPHYLFEQAWFQSLEAESHGEVPVGAIICRRQEPPETTPPWLIISKERNRIVEYHDATAHAELLAIRTACAVQYSERLDRCVMITTLEPCIMCIGAAVLSRLEAIYYFTPVQSGIGAKDILEFENTRDKDLNHRPEMHLVEEYREKSTNLLKSFFRIKRFESGESG